MNRLLFIALACLSLSACDKDDDGLNQSLEEGLVAHYPLDGNGNDLINNNHAVLMENVVFLQDRKGEPEKAAYFNGLNAFIKILSIDAIDFKPTQDFTISTWLSFGTQDETSVSTNSVISKWCLDGASDNCGGTPHPFRLRVANSTSNTPGMIVGYRQLKGAAEECDKSVSVNSEQLNYADNIYHNVVMLKRGVRLFLYVDGTQLNILK